MSLFENILVLLALISASAFFSMSEIALAAARKIRLKQLASDGEPRAALVLKLQENPGRFITVAQIGLNAVAILGGILGEAAFTPHILGLLQVFSNSPMMDTLAFGLSVFMVTSLFILFADLMPKRLAMLAPEKVAIALVNLVMLLLFIVKPLVWFFNSIANAVFYLLKIPTSQIDQITPEDIVAMMDEGAQAGVLAQQEHKLLENVFDMDSRTVTSAMTARESLIYFTLKETGDSIKAKIAEHPHAKFIVVDDSLDKVVGYVDSRDILMQVLHQQPINLLKENIIHTPLIVPDTLSLYEVLAHFKSGGVDFAVVLNEYALTVGVVTLKDVMSIVMGELVNSDEEQIVQRDEESWLVEGLTPLDDVMRVFDIAQFPDEENYETIAGFMMYMLRKIPKRTDFVIYQNYKFEVVDIDSYKIDQLLVTKVKPSEPAEG